MQFDREFCQEEERCGFTVSTDMKKVWSVQLDLLNQFDRVCQEHGLTYFAGGGTLLGAVRHKGFIPWDDDIDVHMPRADYDKLIATCCTAFEEPYFLQHAYDDKNYSRGHAQLRNSQTTAILNSEKGKYTFNQGIFIDIFPLDEIADDEKEYAAQCHSVKMWTKALAATVRYAGSTKKTKMKSVVHTLLKPLPYRWLYRHMEKACKQYEGQHTQRVALISFDVGNSKLVFPAHCIAETQRVPFENTSILIPKGYDEMLTIQYNDYMTMRQENSYHGGILFDTERSYKDYLK